MAEKEYKTYRQLLTILRSRGMVIGKGSQGSRVMRILEKENYYNVINGYKDLFLDTTSTPTAEEYMAGTTFDEVYALYNFDREVRNIYLKYLLKIENEFKTVLAHECSAQYGHDNYLKLENFDDSQGNISSVVKLIGDIQQEIARQMNKRHQVVTHYMIEYGYIPLWVLVNVLTFGKITTFYQLLKSTDKVNIARKFGVSKDELHKYMKMCGLARNKCAHDERFFDMKFKERLHTRSIANFGVLNLARDASGSYPSGTNDVYAIAIIFAMLLSKTDIKEFVSAMKAAFAKLDRQLHTISLTDVMSHMGYQSSWEQLIHLK